MRLQSSSLELENVIGKEQFARLYAREPDGRKLFGLASKQFGISELQLMVHIGQKMGLPVLKSLSPETTVFQVTNIELKAYERAAFVLFNIGSQFHGIACLDPAWVSPYFDKIKNFQIVLSPWSLLKKLISGSPSTNHDLDRQLQP